MFVRNAARFLVPHVRFVVRTRVTCPRSRSARRHRGGAVRARAALGRRARVRAAAGTLECCRARLLCGLNYGQICDQGRGLFAAAAAVSASRAQALATTEAPLSVVLRHNCWPLRRDTYV